MLSINSFKDVTTENPNDRVWKFLRNFTDGKYVANLITTYQAVPEGQRKNVAKQAEQIGYCIRQAEEYFRASAQVGLATRPLLLYYGAVSLSQALILLKKDGTYSLDAMRKNQELKKHRSHGLELIGDPSFRMGNTPEDFLGSLLCRVCRSNGQPWGHFVLVCSVLCPVPPLVRAYFVTYGKPSQIESRVLLTPDDLVLGFEAPGSGAFNLLGQMQTLPDMHHNLIEFNIASALVTGNSEFYQTIYRTVSTTGEEAIDHLEQVWNFFVDGIELEDKKRFLQYYQQKNPNLAVIADHGANFYMRHTVPNAFEAKAPIYLPDMVEDIRGRQFYILDPEQYLPEAVTYLLILYCLGMLSRYHPDVWMKAIDKSVPIAELIDTFLSAAYRKYPNLILDQMTLTRHIIHI